MNLSHNPIITPMLFLMIMLEQTFKPLNHQMVQETKKDPTLLLFQMAESKMSTIIPMTMMALLLMSPMMALLK